MQGLNPLPESVMEKYAQTGGQLCKDVFLISEFGRIRPTRPSPNSGQTSRGLYQQLMASKSLVWVAYIMLTFMILLMVFPHVFILLL